MKIFMFLFFIVFNSLSIGYVPTIYAKERSHGKYYFELKELYDFHCSNPSDINEHLPILRDLALECQSVTEIGVRSMVSTWAILQGLSEHKDHPTYLGIDLSVPPMDNFKKAKKLARSNGVSFKFWKANDMKIEIMPVDLLFIDSLHTYCHLTYELEKFSPKVNKFIALHDTSEPWGNQEDLDYQGNYSEYPANIDRSKKGLWPAVEDFLTNHPEWSLYHRYLNLHGFTILQRIN